MALLIDTQDVPAPDRAALWAACACNTYHPLHFRFSGNGECRGRLWRDVLLSLGLLRIMASPSIMTRTRRDIALGDPDCVCLLVLLSGTLRCAQRDRSSLLRPRDITSYDSSEPALFHAPEPFDALVLKLPKSRLGQEADTIAPRTALRIPGHAGWPRLAVGVFCELADGLADGSIGADDPVLAKLAVDLVRRLYSDLKITPDRGTRSSAELLLCAQVYIEANLRDPHLDPQQVARACCASVAFLHRAFADAQLTVRNWIRTERLDACRRDLAAPGLADEPISAIAARWGMPDRGHFSRLFRSSFGCSPQEFRRRARSETSRGWPAAAVSPTPASGSLVPLSEIGIEVWAGARLRGRRESPPDRRPSADQ